MELFSLKLKKFGIFLQKFSSHFRMNADQAVKQRNPLYSKMTAD